MLYIDYIYDIETYPNCFTFRATEVLTGLKWVYEISDRRDDTAALLQFLWALSKQHGSRMVGFNNEGFDYPIIHLIMMMGESVTVGMIYNKTRAIITGERFDNIIWEQDRFIEQVDLFKIHHFDNQAKSTSLKVLEFNMRSESIEDLPFPPGTILTDEQKDKLIEYNGHDVDRTLDFYSFTLPMIRFREELSEKYGRNFINFNDTKIGKEYFITELEKAGVQCYDRSSGRREPRQTVRHSIRLGDVILPYINFNRPELHRFKMWLADQTITETKGVFKDLSVDLDGFSFDFGLGGIHGSIDSAIVRSTDTHAIIDIDVKSFYPNISIRNRLYPEHLGPVFCDIYRVLYEQRAASPKKSSVNAMLKLALNGTYGDSNNVYSVFYDPKFTMAITINGQLSLCMLSEQLMTIPGLRMIQANTDGVTVHIPRQHIDQMQAKCRAWEQLTGLELEHAHYSRMFIRDVNNYIAEGEDGTIKRKGAYAHETPLENPNTLELEWHKNHSARIVTKAAESALLDGEDISWYIRNHPQAHDFMLRTKIPRSSKLMLGDRQLQNVSRYYIAHNGEYLQKVMPPLKKEVCKKRYLMPDASYLDVHTKTGIKEAERKGGVYTGDVVMPGKDRHFDINKGWRVVECNNMANVTTFDFNYDWYIAEAEKLVKPLKEFV